MSPVIRCLLIGPGAACQLQAILTQVFSVNLSNLSKGGGSEHSTRLISFLFQIIADHWVTPNGWGESTPSVVVLYARKDGDSLNGSILEVPHIHPLMNVEMFGLEVPFSDLSLWEFWGTAYICYLQQMTRYNHITDANNEKNKWCSTKPGLIWQSPPWNKFLFLFFSRQGCGMAPYCRLIHASFCGFNSMWQAILSTFEILQRLPTGPTPKFLLLWVICNPLNVAALVRVAEYFFINFFGGQIETNLMMIIFRAKNSMKYFNIFDRNILIFLRNQFVVCKWWSQVNFLKSRIFFHYFFGGNECGLFFFPHSQHSKTQWFNLFKVKFHKSPFFGGVIIFFFLNCGKKIKMTRMHSFAIRKRIQKARCSTKNIILKYFFFVKMNLTKKKNVIFRNLTCNPHLCTENWFHNPPRPALQVPVVCRSKEGGSHVEPPLFFRISTLVQFQLKLRTFLHSPVSNLLSQSQHKYRHMMYSQQLILFHSGHMMPLSITMHHDAMGTENELSCFVGDLKTKKKEVHSSPEKDCQRVALAYKHALLINLWPLLTLRDPFDMQHAPAKLPFKLHILHSDCESKLFFEHGWSNNRRFLAVSACQLQAVEQFSFAVSNILNIIFKFFGVYRDIIKIYLHKDFYKIRKKFIDRMLKAIPDFQKFKSIMLFKFLYLTQSCSEQFFFGTNRTGETLFNLLARKIPALRANRLDLEQLKPVWKEKKNPAGLLRVLLKCVSSILGFHGRKLLDGLWMLCEHNGFQERYSSSYKCHKNSVKSSWNIYF
ncbi:putative signal peptide protein [Puccinia sorghi]|uniref:Putative signal peptide protein n=1 Tax=Puccinia sorghi TaxID=27349 RepID=A0A0L6UY40_9BASI|nr:putative signal peptide protein [Puccinia sorghi]